MEQGKLKKTFNGVIRNAEMADLAAIMKLERRCFGADGWPAAAVTPYLSRSGQPPLQAAFFLAVTPAVPSTAPVAAGYILGALEKPDEGEILYVAVAPEFRHQALGRALLDRVCDSLTKAGAKKILLQVEQNNHAAIHLYEAAGFVKNKVLYDYYGPNRGAYEMSRSFNP